MTIILTLIFFGLLFFFGWQISRRFLHEDTVEYLLPIGGAIGIGAYLLLLNVLGYVISIQKAYVVTFAFFVLFFLYHILSSVRSYFGEKPVTWCTSGATRMFLLGSALLFMTIVFVISARHPMDLFTLREPTAMTIAHGNFPVKEIWSPENPLLYHYAPDLFSAALLTVTGMPLYITYDVQIAVFSGILLLLGFILAHRFFPDTRPALGASFLMLYAGSLTFLYGLRGVPLIISYLSEQSSSINFKFITDAMGEAYALPGVNYVVHVHWGAMAFVFTLLPVYLYLTFVRKDSLKSGLPYVVISALMLALLALIAESFFVILFGVIFFTPGILYLMNVDRPRFKKMFFSTLVFLGIAGFVAVFQGGVLQSAVYQQLNVGTKTEDTVMLYTDKNEHPTPIHLDSPFTLPDETSVFSTHFFLSFGLLLILLPFATYALLKKDRVLIPFMVALTGAFFIAPLIFDSPFEFIKFNIIRFAYPVTVLGGFILGIWLTQLLLEALTIRRKIFACVLFLLLAFQGIWTQFIWVTFGYPPGEGFWSDAAFFVESGPEAEAYAWVRAHTTIKDTFLIMEDDYTGCGVAGSPNCYFVFNTGRMAPTFRYHKDVFIEDTKAALKIRQFEELQKTCDPKLIEVLGYRYLFVDRMWSREIEEMCVEKNNVDLVFESGEGDTFTRIYEIRN